MLRLLSIITLVCLSVLLVTSCSSEPKINGLVNLGLKIKGNGISVVAISPTNDNVIYAGNLAEFFRSDDGGQTWQKTSLGFGDQILKFPGTYGFFFTVSPSDPYCAYANFNGLKKTIDGGQTWNVVLPDEFPDEYNYYKIAIAPSNPNIFYMEDGLSVVKTLDGGQSWTTINNGNNRIDFGSSSALALAIDPSNPEVVFAGTNGGLFKTIDGGTNWFRSDPDIEGFKGTYNILIDPNFPNIVYIDERTGAYRSSDGGASWQQTNLVNPQMRLFPISVISWVISPEGGTVYALVTGSRVFEYSAANDQWTEPTDYGMITPLCLACSSHFVYVGTDAGLFRYARP